MLVYPSRKARSPRSSGRAGRRRRVDVDWYTSRGKTLDGAGLDPAVVPGALHAALTVLEKWGTMSFAEVSARAIEYAERRIPAAPAAPRSGDRAATQVLQEVAGQPELLAEAGRLDVQARRDDQAADARAHAEADGRGRARRAKSKGRAAGIVAARDRFYKGDIAKEMVAFLQAARRAVRARATSPSTSRASKSRRRRPIAATRSTSTRSRARARCCCRR